MADSVTTEKLVSLARRLLNLTQHGVVVWTWSEESDSLVAALTYHGGSGTVWLFDVDEDGQPPIELNVDNPQGYEVGRIRSHERADDGTLMKTPHGDLLVELYEISRRKALGADEVLQGLMGELDKLDGA